MVSRVYSQRDSGSGLSKPEEEARSFRAQDKLEGLLHRHENTLLGLAGVVFFVGLWSAVSLFGLVPEYVLPGPLSVAISMYDLFASGAVVPHLWFSMQEFFVGYSFAALSGVAIGLLMGWYHRVNYFLDMLVSALYSTPRVAFVSLFLILFGVIGIWKTAATVFIMAFFPILVSTLAGVKLCEESYVKVGRSLSASDSQLIKDVVIPGSIPSIIAGLRLGTGLGLTAIVVGDLYGAQAGLGYLLFLYGNAFRTSDMIAVILVFSLAGILVNRVLGKVEDHYSAWKPSIAD